MKKPEIPLPRLVVFLFGFLLILYLSPALAETRSVSGTVYLSQFSEKDELQLTGDTTLVVDTNQTLKSISGDHALTIEGASPTIHTLTIESSGHGIQVSSFTFGSCLLTIDSKRDGLNIEGDIKVYGGLLSVDAGKDGLFSRNGNILVYGGIIGASCGTNCSAISAKGGSIVMTGGTISASGAMYGLYAPQGKILLNGNVTAHAGGWAVYGGTIEIASGKTEAGSVGQAICSLIGGITINAEVEATSRGDGASAISALKNVTINGKVTANSKLNAAAIRSGTGDITVQGGTVTAAGSMYGFYAPEGVVTLNGTVKATAGGWAIYGEEGIDIESGKTTAESGGQAITSFSGSITLDGDVRAVSNIDGASAINAAQNVTVFGKVYAYSKKNGAAIRAGNGRLRIAYGTVYADGSKYGLYAQNGSIEIDGTVYAEASGTALWAKKEILIFSGKVSATGGKAIVADSLTIHSPLQIFSPVGGSNDGQRILDADGKVAGYALIDTSEWKIVFDANGGVGNMSPVTVKAGNEYTLPECSFTAPEGKCFYAWNLGAPGDSLVVNQNYQLSPIWIPDLKIVSLDPGEGSGSPSSVKVLKGNEYLTGDPTTVYTAPDGQEFYCWQINGSDDTCFPGDRILILKDTVLTALYRDKAPLQQLYPVSFDKNGGYGSKKTVHVLGGNTYTLPENPFDPPGTTQHFTGWSVTGVDGVCQPGDPVVISGDTVVTALWGDPPFHTVTFVTSGHGTAPESISIQEGKPMWNAWPEAPTAEGSVFFAWYTEPEYETIISQHGLMPNHDITAYAKWLNEIREIEIMGFMSPVADEYAPTLQDLRIPMDAHYSIDSITWMDGETYRVIPQPFKFEAGKSYYAQIDLYAEDGWAFRPVDFPTVPTPGFLPSDFDVFALDGMDVREHVVTDSSYHCSLQTDILSSLEIIKEGDCGEKTRYSLNLVTGGLTISGSGSMWDYLYGEDDSPFSENEHIRWVTVEEGVTRIGSDAFYGCPNLESVTMESVTDIGSSAFFDCSALKSVSLPNTLTRIGEGAFGHCTALTDLELPEGIRELGDYAFTRTGLKEISLPESLTHVGSYAFYRCADLKEAKVKSNGLSLGTEVFLEDPVTLSAEPDSTAAAYAKQNGLTFQAVVFPRMETPDFSLPKGLKSISDEAFEGMTARIVRIQDGTKSIGERAFADCVNLAQIRIPASVTSIGAHAFDGCPWTLQIFGKAGSAAESFAMNAGFKFIEE